METLGEVRKTALELWLKAFLIEEIDSFHYDFDKSEWCKLQEEFSAKNLHSNFICSFIEWLDNITDLLTDDRFDSKKFDVEDDAAILFRYYTKIFLVASEILDDYTHLYRSISPVAQKKEARKHLHQDLDLLFRFTNTVCKHKILGDNLHSCNNHLNILFQDFDDTLKLEFPSRANQKIVVPSLIFLIKVIIGIDADLISQITTEADVKETFFKYHSESY